MSALEVAKNNLLKLGAQYKSGQHVLIGQALDDIFMTENELVQLRDRISSLETALKCAAVCNETNNPWGMSSPFQAKIEELVGKAPYGDK